MKIETGPITVVEWIDSLMTDFAPVTEKDLECAIITSTGYLVKETDVFIALARDYSDTSEHWRGVVVIPKVAIRSREVAMMAGGLMPRATFDALQPRVRCAFCAPDVPFTFANQAEYDAHLHQCHPYELKPAYQAYPAWLNKHFTSFDDDGLRCRHCNWQWMGASRFREFDRHMLAEHADEEPPRLTLSEPTARCPHCPLVTHDAFPREFMQWHMDRRHPGKRFTEAS